MGDVQYGDGCRRGRHQAGGKLDQLLELSTRPENSYPVSGYSWIVVYKKPADAGRAKLLYDVLSWLAGPQGQSNAKSVDYVPLPHNVQETAASTLNQMQR